MIKTLTNTARHTVCAILLFISFLFIYWFSIPNSFNTRDDNRRFFDSDGEFIVRQFREAKTFTHNDHLLYHILAKFIFDHSEKMSLEKNYITPHKILSCVFGALGVTFFYIFGALITGHFVLPLLCALFAGGTAGWWFFSATIDTYVPCLSVSIPVLGLAVMSLKKETLTRSIMLGFFAGLAFLLRTDGFLLALLGIYLLRNKNNAVDNAIAVIIPGAMVGIIGYALLAHFFYDVSLNAGSLFQWARSGLQRPEAVKKNIWGTTENITMLNTATILVNQLLYTIVIPGLEKTRNPSFFLQYVKGGWIPLTIYLYTLGLAVYHLCRKISRDLQRSDRTAIFIAALAGMWFFSRMIFYTWWDPFDPFLFAVMSLPAIWLVMLTGFQYALEKNGLNGKIRYWCILGVMTVAVWLHNIYYMIEPIRKHCC